MPGADQTQPLIGARSTLAPAPAIHCLPGVGRVWVPSSIKDLVCRPCMVWPPQESGVPSPRIWCAPSRSGALPRKVWCAFSRGESHLEGRVWCTLSRSWEGLVYPLQELGGSGVPSPGAGRVWCALPSKCYSYCHYCSPGEWPFHLVSSTSYGKVAIG